MQWWTDFWIWANENPLPATVIGTLIASGLIWLLARLPKIGPHVRKALKWVWSWRPVSARRHDREVTHLIRELAEGNVARKKFFVAANQEINRVRESIPEVALVLSNQIVEQKQRVDVIMNAVEDQDKALKAIQNGSSKSRAIVVGDERAVRVGTGSSTSAPPTIPSPDPRWRLYLPDGNDSKYVLANSVARSVAKEVRLESKDFNFLDGAHWEDLSGVQKGEFDGRPVAGDEAWKSPMQFIVTWYNENAVKNSEAVLLDVSGWTPF